MDKHEYDDDVSDTIADRAEDSSPWLTIVGGGRFRFKSSFRPLPFLPLMVVPFFVKYVTCFD